MATIFRKAHCSNFFALAFAVAMGIATSGHAMDVTLGWNANTETNLKGYKIYYGTNQGGPYNGSGSSDGASPLVVLLSSLSNLKSPEYTVHGLSEGSYYFVVTAFSTEGVESGFSNEVGTGAPSGGNSPPVLSSLEVNGENGSTTVYTNKRQIAVRIVASDDRLVSHYLILDGESNPAGNTFVPVPGGPKQNPIITVNEFLLNDADGSRTIYAWVKDDQGLISAAAGKHNVVLTRSTTGVGEPMPESEAPSSTVTYRNRSLYQERSATYESNLNGTVSDALDSYNNPRKPIEVLEAIPVHNLGMSREENGVPQKTGFSVRIDSINGVDLTEQDSITFTITDGERTYTRRLNDSNGDGIKLLRAVSWDEEGDIVYGFWAVYYRSNETAIPNTYPTGSVIEVTVNAKDMVGEIIDPLTFRFRIQTDEEIETEAANLPETLTAIDPLTSMKRTTITSGPLSGASIVFSTSLQEEMGFEPYFGPLEAIPFLAGLETAGTPLNLLPHTLFTSPVTLVIPCPENENAKNMAVYYHDGRAWWLASDREGNVVPNGEGWMAPGSRINHEQDPEGPDFIEIQVYHFSAAAAASPPQIHSSGGGTCFISSLWK
jgi:hypothetical protein